MGNLNKGNSDTIGGNMKSPFQIQYLDESFMSLVLDYLCQSPFQTFLNHPHKYPPPTHTHKQEDIYIYALAPHVCLTV